MTNTDKNIDDSKVEQLLQGAGKRAPLPDDVRDRLEQTFRAELSETRGRHNKTRLMTYGSLAASVLVAALLTIGIETTEPRDQIASVTRELGEVRWQYEESTGPLKTGNSIQIGDVITTTSGSVSLSPVGSSMDIRLAPECEVSFVDAKTLLLSKGAVYVDSDPAAEHFPLIIIVDDITVRHVGTQYLVDRNGRDVDIAVREGEINIDLGGKTITSIGSTGTGELNQFVAGELVASMEIPTHDDRWSWAAGLSPAIDTDGMQMASFLDWVASQSGYEVQVDELIDDSIPISGSIPTMDAFYALDQAMRITGYSAEIDRDQGTITIF